MSSVQMWNMHTAKRKLAADILRDSGALRLCASGWSMLPTIWPGDTLVIERVTSDDVLKGDIVTFSRAGRFVAHRVMTKYAPSDDFAIQTRGDALLEQDPPISSSEFLGKVALIERNGKCSEPGKTLRPSARLIATVLQHSPFAVRVVLKIHGMLRTAFRQNFSNRALSCQN